MVLVSSTWIWFLKWNPLMPLLSILSVLTLYYTIIRNSFLTSHYPLSCPNCSYKHVLILFQRAKVTTTTPMTTELFFQWKKKKMEERDAGLAAQQAERAKNDRMRLITPFNPSFIANMLDKLVLMYSSVQWTRVISVKC